MQTKPNIRHAWDYLYNQGAVGNTPVSKTAMRANPLQVKNEYIARQLANLAIGLAKVRT
jgi:hypothetical protein